MKFKDGSLEIPNVFESLTAYDEIICVSFDGRVANIPKDEGLVGGVVIEGVEVSAREEFEIVTRLFLVTTHTYVKNEPLRLAIYFLSYLRKVSLLHFT
jgi:hypothetical protein